MSDETKVGEARAGFEPEVVASKSGRRHLSDASARELLSRLPELAGRHDAEKAVCPYIHRSGEGTSYCSLAEAGAKVEALKDAVCKAAEEYVETVSRYEAEAAADDSGQLVCGTGMLVIDRLAALRKAVDDLCRARGGEGSEG